METLTRSAKGRKPKRGEKRTEGINIRATPSEFKTLLAIVEMSKENKRPKSQADVLLGGMQAGEAVRKIYELRQDLVATLNFNQTRHAKRIRDNNPEDVEFLRGQIVLLSEIINRIDEALNTA